MFGRTRARVVKNIERNRKWGKRNQGSRGWSITYRPRRRS